MDFNDNEIEAYQAAGEEQGEILVSSQSLLMRDYWRRNISSSVFVPSFKDCTIGQAHNLCFYWDIDTTPLDNYSSRGFQAVTWLIALITIAVITVLSVLIQPWGLYVAGAVALVFVSAKIVGHFNDKDLRFNDLRQKALEQAKESDH